MKKIPVILFVFFLSFPGLSQRTIRGRVVNSTTGAPVPGSSVFVSGTSRGTISSSAGVFELNDLPTGTHDLVISSIGYETNVFSFSDGQLPLQLKIELAIKVKELENVTVEPSVLEGWDKWGKAFMDNFVGNTENSGQCRIKNEQAIKFRYFKKSNRLVAFCEEPVLLENKALGYMIKYQLEDFEVDFGQRSVSFLGYSLFEPIGTDSRSKQQKWDSNREEAYNGSIMHFMRSLYSNRLEQEGFEVRRMVRSPNYEKRRVKEVYKVSRVMRTNRSTGQTTIEYLYGENNIPRDSLSYYESVMKQDDYTDTYGAGLLTSDSLLLDTGNDFKALHFDDYIFITYTKEKEEAGYLRSQFSNRRAGLQRSFVTLLNDKLISLDKAGSFFDPRDFFTSGYWSWSEKMAGSLPLDYK